MSTRSVPKPAHHAGRSRMILCKRLSCEKIERESYMTQRLEVFSNGVQMPACVGRAVKYPNRHLRIVSGVSGYG